LNPSNHVAHYDLGVALETTGERHGALEEYSEAYRLSPNTVRYQQACERLSH
jgi:Flp pilus assembly protein TadD